MLYKFDPSDSSITGCTVLTLHRGFCVCHASIMAAR
jgi:hypothetical protein